MKNFSKIHAFGSSVPLTSVANKEFEHIVETSDQWIVERTGIKSRFMCQPHENTLMLALAAARKTLEQANIALEDIGGIIVGTSSNDYLFPSLGCLLAGQLGIKGFAFDVQAACSGFLYAMHIARQFVENNTEKHILIVGVDVISRALDWNDRKTCILFGDGAGSCLVSATDRPGFLYSMIAAQADQELSLMLTSPWSNRNARHKIKMDGQKVFKKAVGCLSSCVATLLKESGLTPESIDIVIPHQANGRILQAVAERTPIPIDKYYQCLERYGNTSAASIPLAFVDAQKEGLIQRDMHVMMIAFGGGMTYGGSVVKIL